jgi:23S rRNA (uracil1939-C5)-methyltransferase
LDREITFDVRGFFQSNLFVFEKVIELITGLLPGGENILDMYSGCGSISAFLGKKYKNVVLVEHNRDALVYAELNMAGTNHTSYGLSGENWVKTCASSCPAFDAAVVDPPRSGMEKAVLDYFCKSSIPFIVYLSCNPSTQSRDCAKLIQNGYNIKKAYLLDFYPNTSHIESLVVLEKI